MKNNPNHSRILNKRIEVYTKQPVTNEIGKTHHEYKFFKKTFASIEQIRRRILEGEADTKYSSQTIVFKIRTRSLPDIDETYKFKYKGRLYEVRDLDYDYDDEGLWVIQTEMVVE